MTRLLILVMFLVQAPATKFKPVDIVGTWSSAAPTRGPQSFTVAIDKNDHLTVDVPRSNVTQVNIFSSSAGDKDVSALEVVAADRKYIIRFTDKDHATFEMYVVFNDSSGRSNYVMSTPFVRNK